MVKDSAMDTQRLGVRAGAACVALAGRRVREPGLGPGERQEGLV